MEEKTDIKTLNVEDNVLFQKRDNKQIKWYGKVDEIKTKSSKDNIKITYFALFEVNGKWGGKKTGHFSPNWNALNWALYKITKKETKKYKKELILLNLK